MERVATTTSSNQTDWLSCQKRLVGSPAPSPSVFEPEAVHFEIEVAAPADAGEFADEFAVEP